ncbi:hypothetical protein ACQEPB_00535 [Novosphingobium fluoreni]|uniref:hypothetical protein n=1 Tax=Novosphingobium fluoreni TaxID=1391222 RepID=UPI003DA0667F
MALTLAPGSTDQVLTGQATDTTLPIAYEDDGLEGAAAGLRSFYHDLVNASSWPASGPALTNGTVLKNLDLSGNDGALVNPNGEGAFNGNGLDFTGVTKRSSLYLRGSSAPLADIRGSGLGSGATATASLSGTTATASVTAGGTGYTSQARALYYGGGLPSPVTVTPTVTSGAITAIPALTNAALTSAPSIAIIPKRQFFFAELWVKLPSAANWTSDTSNGGYFPIFQCADENKAVIDDPDLFLLAEFAAGQVLRLRRQIAGATGTYSAGDSIDIAPGAGDYGSVCQIGVWRHPTLGFGAQLHRLDSAAPIVAASVVTATGAENPFDFSPKTPKFGFGVGEYALTSGTGGTFSAGQANAAKGRCYAFNIEPLDPATPRDPVAALLASWKRKLARPASFAFS